MFGDFNTDEANRRLNEMETMYQKLLGQGAGRYPEMGRARSKITEAARLFTDTVAGVDGRISQKYSSAQIRAQVNAIHSEVMPSLRSVEHRMAGFGSQARPAETAETPKDSVAESGFTVTTMYDPAARQVAAEGLVPMWQPSVRQAPDTSPSPWGPKARDVGGGIVEVDTNKLSGSEVLSFVDKLVGQAGDAYKGFLAQQISAQQKTNSAPKVQVPKATAQQAGIWKPWMTASAVVAGVAIGGVVLYMLARPRRQPAMAR